jgi:aldose 1-epimerase
VSETICIRAGAAEAVLVPSAGGRIGALRVDGLEVIVSVAEGPVYWGCYPMVPWAGRLRDGVLRWGGETHRFPTHLAPPHALHGTLLESPWEMLEVAPDTVVMAARLGPPWPFGGRAVQRIRLAPDALRAEIEVHAAERPMPVIVGWHPWFARILRSAAGSRVGAPVEVDLPAGGMLRRGPDGIPTGEVVRPIPPGPWDDCFVDLAGDPVVRWPGALEVTLSSDARWWVLYTERQEGICVEPQTGPPNGLGTGEHTIVEPGRPLVAAMTIAWRRLDAG